MKFMTHPLHGAMHVQGNEVETHEKNGWKLSTYETWLAPKLGKVKAAKESADETLEKLVKDEKPAVEVAPAKRGPKPKAK